MRLSLERQAGIANGLLLIVAGLMVLIPSSRSAGIALCYLMGIGLIFSGISHYCGWIRLLSYMPWNRPVVSATGDSQKFR